MANIRNLLPSRINFTTFSFQVPVWFLFGYFHTLPPTPSQSKLVIKPLTGISLEYIKSNKVFDILNAAVCLCYLRDYSLPGWKLHVSRLLLLVGNTEGMQAISFRWKKTHPNPQFLSIFFVFHVSDTLLDRLPCTAISGVQQKISRKS